MISVIISSANTFLLAQVSKNIEATIAVPFELISFDNSTGQKGICEIYNMGARRAQYDILCFMHEDIEIQTSGWGLKVASHFTNNPQLGLLGVAGCSYKSKSPSGWVGYGVTRILHYNLLQSLKDKKNTEHHCMNPNNAVLQKVACIDGLWFCTTKSVSIAYPFDEHLLKGFHSYDIDFSLAINQKYNAMVTYEILLNHFSEGTFNADWIEDILKVSKKWESHLPLNIAGLTKKESLRVEIRTCEDMIKKMLHNGMTLSACLRMIFRVSYKESNLFIKFKLFFYLVKKRNSF